MSPAPLVGREEAVVPDPHAPHPLYLVLGQRGDPEMVRVDDPALDPIYFGAPDLGWEGDHRLAVYSWPARNTFALVRLCPDGEYRWIRALDSIRPLSPGEVNATVRWLVAHDARRGFDAAEAVLAHNEALEVARRAQGAEWAAAQADRLAWGLRRDLSAHLGGRDWNFIPAKGGPDA